MPKYTEPTLEGTISFLESVKEKYQLKNDAALARFIELPPPVISKLVNGKVDFNFGHVVTFHLKTEIPVASIMHQVGIDQVETAPF